MLQLTEQHADWLPQFTKERARLLKVLGAITDGGSIEQIAHVGATSVPVCRRALSLTLR